MIKKSKRGGKNTTWLKRQVLKQEPELYTNSILLAFFVNNLNYSKKNQSEKNFFKLFIYYKLKYKLLLTHLILKGIEKIKPALIGKPINRRIKYRSEVKLMIP